MDYSPFNILSFCCWSSCVATHPEYSPPTGGLESQAPICLPDSLPLPDQIVQHAPTATNITEAPTGKPLATTACSIYRSTGTTLLHQCCPTSTGIVILPAPLDKKPICRLRDLGLLYVFFKKKTEGWQLLRQLDRTIIRGRAEGESRTTERGGGEGAQRSQELE